MQPLLPMLLREQGFATESSNRSRDFQHRVGRPDTGHGDGPQPCVVLLTRAADREADMLSLHLAAASVPVVRFDCDRVPGTGVSYAVGTGDTGSRLDVDGLAARPLVVWSRYFTADSVPAESGADRRLVGYLRGQWVGWRDLLVGADGARVLNPATVPDRITQLHLATVVGLRIPATVVTSTPASAAAALPGTGDVILKSLAEHYIEAEPGRLDGLFARRLTRTELAANPDTEGAPVIVQQFVPAQGEWRVYVVGEQFHTFAAAPHAAHAPFTDAASVSVRRVDTPEAIRAPLLELMHRWQLDVAAFDLLDTPDGPVFLEANASCDWLWLEHATGSRDVTDAVVDRVVTAFREGVAA